MVNIKLPLFYSCLTFSLYLLTFQFVQKNRIPDCYNRYTVLYQYRQSFLLVCRVFSNTANRINAPLVMFCSDSPIFISTIPFRITPSLANKPDPVMLSCVHARSALFLPASYRKEGIFSHCRLQIPRDQLCVNPYH